MHNIKLKDRQGNFITYNEINTIKVPDDADQLVAFKSDINAQEKTITITENKTEIITPDTDYEALSKVTVDVDVPTTTLETLTTSIVFQGDEQIMKTTAPSGVSYSEVDIVRPPTLIPENIKENVQIAGVTGTYEGGAIPEETTVDLSMADGNQVITADEGKAFSKVTVNKPNTLIPDNIVKDIDIGGVVGTHVSPELTATTVTLAFIDGGEYKMYVTAPKNVGYGLVAILRPETLMAKNIKKDINIAGITGSYEGPPATSKLVYPDFENVTEQVITAPSDEVWNEIRVRRPALLLPSNIKSDVEIAGVTGTYTGAPSSVGEITLALAAGDQTVNPPSGEVFSSVVVKKPSKLLPNNIKDGVDIAGITGTYKGRAQSEYVKLDMATGDQVITPSGDYYFSSVTVMKDTTFIPENIRAGVNIGNVWGTYEGAKDEEEKTVALDMFYGSQIVSPTAGKVLSKVIITKPDTLIPENIKDTVDIGGVTGSLVDADTFIQNAWTQDGQMCEKGFGIARNGENGIYIKAYMTSNNRSDYIFSDQGYQNYFSVPWNTMANTNLMNNLEGFCAGITNELYDTIFAEADTVCFMDTLHPVSTPQISLSETGIETNVDKFVKSLTQTLADVPTNYGDPLYMSPYNYSEPWEGTMPADISHFPFVWFPAVKDGSPIKTGVAIQPPTGTMTTYQSMYKTYTWEDTLLSNNGTVSVTAGYVNALIPFGSSDFVCWIIGDGSGGLLWWSIKDQLVRKELLQMIRSDWASGDVTLAQGFNMTTSVSAGSNTTVPITDEQLSAFTVKGDNIPLSEMDDFEKSFYKELTRQPYRRLNKKSVTIDFTIKMPPEAT